MVAAADVGVEAADLEQDRPSTRKKTDSTDGIDAVIRHRPENHLGFTPDIGNAAKGTQPFENDSAVLDPKAVFTLRANRERLPARKGDSLNLLADIESH